MPKQRIVFWDVDTQVDFMHKDGKLYVPAAEIIVGQLRRLTAAARIHGIPLISSVDAHTLEDEEFREWPPHCLRGTPGQLKIPETILEGFYAIPNCPGAPVPDDIVKKYPQVILEKQRLDVFSNPNTEVLLQRLDRQAEFVVFGVATEYCVRHTALGLLHRERNVTLLTDATQAIQPQPGRHALEEMVARGARPAATTEVLDRL